MREQEIIEGNKLIAEFCNVGYWQVWRKNGYKPHWADKYMSPEVAMQAVDLHYGMESMRVEFEPKFITPKYESDWNELMPVVEKIKNITDFDTEVGGKHNRNPDFSQALHELLSCLKTVDIGIVWLAVTAFIKWYNQNK